MPRRLTRPEVATRIAIKVLSDAYPAMTHRQLVTFFHVSPRTVTEAMRRPASLWAGVLRAAPEPGRTASSRLRAKPRTVMPRRPGSRAHAKLNPPEATIDILEQSDFDVPEPVIDEEAQERAITDALEKEDRKMRGVDDDDS